MLNAQRLPTEIILNILECYIGDRLWLLPSLLTISKSIRAGLLRWKSPDIHLYSVLELEYLTDFVWKKERRVERRSQAEERKRRKIDQTSPLQTSPKVRGLYLHFFDYDHLLRLLRNSTLRNHKVVETLGMQIFHSSSESDASLAMRLCKHLRSLKRLYIDMTIHPLSPIYYDRRGSMQPYRGQYGRAFEKINKKVETFALFFHDNDVLPRSFACYIHCLFPGLKRLYLFSRGNADLAFANVVKEVDGSYFDLKTSIKLVVNIYVTTNRQEREYRIDKRVLCFPNGLKIIERVVVERRNDRPDALGFMHRVIDDIEKEWEPEAFEGYRWDPTTRPRYIVGIPTKANATYIRYSHDGQRLE